MTRLINEFDISIREMGYELCFRTSQHYSEHQQLGKQFISSTKRVGISSGKMTGRPRHKAR